MNRLLKIVLAAAAVSALAAPAAFAQNSDLVSTTGSTTIMDPISIAKNSDLQFGSVVKPSTGANTVIINASTGARTLGGAGDTALVTSTTGRATYTVTGEEDATFSISTPATFDMANGGDSLTVTLTSSAASGTLTSGTATFGVGGSFPIATSTVTGAYSGTFDVTVAYN